MPPDTISTTATIEREEYEYDITSKQNLKTIADQQEFNSQCLNGILDSLIRAKETLDEFFLSENNLVLDPEFIYTDIETKATYLCFYPYYEKDIGESLKELSEFLLQKTDHNDDEAVYISYEFYKLIMHEDYDFGKIFTRRLPKEEQGSFKEEEYEAVDITEDVQEVKTEKIKKAENVSLIVSAVILLILIIFILYVRLYRSSEALSLIREDKLVIIAAAGGSLIAFGPLAVIAKLDHTNKEKIRKKKSEILKMIKDREYKEASVNNVYHGDTSKLGEDAESSRRLVRFEKEGITEMKLDELPFILGKKRDMVDGVLTEASASRLHAKITESEGRYYLEDLNSTNGSFVNNERLTTGEKRELNINDELNFAGEVFYFR